MSTHKQFDKICCVILAATLLLTVLFFNAERFGIQKTSAAPGYETKLFDTSKVHTIDILMDDWDDFIANCQSEAYSNCSVVIDNESFENVAIRGKGNTSLTQVASYGSSRYSFKIEFDHYEDAGTYYGLDKLCLNNIIQDNTYAKDFLVYQMMADIGVASPLCSYVYITVNGNDWGLYLAVEGIEEAFLARSYGSDYGELYKPDSMNMDSRPPDGGMQDDRMQNASADVKLQYIDDNTESYSNIFDNAKTDVSNADKKRLLNALKNLSDRTMLESTLDMDAVIRYFVVHNFVLNFDSYTGSMIHNYYLYEKDGQLQMIPWDYNLAFGGFQADASAEELVNYPIDTPVSDGTVADRPMLAWILESDAYTELYHQAFRTFLTEYFDSGYFETMLDSIETMISPYVEKDPTKFCTYEEFKKGIAALRTFCLLRAESVRGQLDGSIGSTADTQAPGTFIDADNLQISDMGSMQTGEHGSLKRPGGKPAKSKHALPPGASRQGADIPDRPS